MTLLSRPIIYIVLYELWNTVLGRSVINRNIRDAIELLLEMGRYEI